MNRRIILTIFLLTLISSFLLGSEYYVEDMVLHVPQISKHVDSDLYSSDYLFQKSTPQ